MKKVKGIRMIRLKINSAFIVLILFFSFYVIAYSDNSIKKIILPNFLIQKQLAYEIVGLEYLDLSLDNGELKGINDSGYLSRVRLLYSSGFPLAILNQKENQIYMGYRYQSDKFKQFYPYPNSNDLFHSIGINSFWEVKIAEKFYLFTFYQISSNSNKTFNNLKNELGHIFYEKINYKISNNMNAGLGIIYTKYLGISQFLPSIAFAFSSENYLINIDIPIRVEFEYLKDDFRFFTNLSFNSNSYLVSERDKIINFNGISSNLGVKYKFWNILYLYFGLNYNFNEKYTLGTKDNMIDIGEISNNFGLNLGIKMHLIKNHE